MKMFLRKTVLLAVVSLLVLTCVGKTSNAITTAVSLRDKGDFKQAETVLRNALKLDGGNLSETERKQFVFEIDLLERLRLDYSLTENVLYKKLQDSVKNLARTEFEQWRDEGRFDSRMIDGERRFVGTSVSNLFFRHPELNPRRYPPKDDADYHKAVLKNVRAIKKAAAREKKPYVSPTRFECNMTVTAETNAADVGALVRAWLPIPRRYPFQTGFKILTSSTPVKYLADEDSPIRAAYFEQLAGANQPTKFQIKYQYATHGIYFDLDAKKISRADISDPALKPFLREAPHVVFSPKIIALARQLAGAETNQMQQARAFYNWIAGNIKYSFAREYSTLTNISDYCLSNGYGDCGQEALLFITLCRSQGIPARWQTGWSIFPGHKTIHDWTEIYLAPYGWVPVDPYMGIFASSYAVNLTPDERREVREFYFGGLDQYRMIANSDHNQELQPPKNTSRSDDVDFQRGELESGNKNIYFDKYSFDLEVKELRPKSPR